MRMECLNCAVILERQFDLATIDRLCSQLLRKQGKFEPLLGIFTVPVNVEIA